MTTRTRYGALAVRSYRALIDPLLLPLRPRIVRACVELAAREVLDIACATGAQCRALGRAAVEATGLDLSPDMIEVARRVGGPNTSYVLGSAYELPFADASFDASLLVLALHEHSEEERATMLAEALRVLRPAGHLIVADYVRPPRPAVHIPWQLIRFVESIAGPEHSAGFRDFVKQGSLDGLLCRHGLTPSHRSASHLGAIQIATTSVRD